MVGPWFTTPWRLVSQSHGAVAQYSPPHLIPWLATPRHPFPPCHVPPPISAYSPRPAPSNILRLLCGRSPTPFSVPSPSPFIPCLYPTWPRATLWRGPTGSSSIRGPFRAPSTGRSLPAPVSFHVQRPVTHLGLFPASRAFPFSWGCCAALATRPSLSRPLFPSSRVYTPLGRKQPFGAGPLVPHPSGDRFLCLALVVPSSPLPFGLCFSF